MTILQGLSGQLRFSSLPNPFIWKRLAIRPSWNRQKFILPGHNRWLSVNILDHMTSDRLDRVVEKDILPIANRENKMVRFNWSGIDVFVKPHADPKKIVEEFHRQEKAKWWKSDFRKQKEEFLVNKDLQQRQKRLDQTLAEFPQVLKKGESEIFYWLGRVSESVGRSVPVDWSGLNAKAKAIAKSLRDLGYQPVDTVKERPRTPKKLAHDLIGFCINGLEKYGNLDMRPSMYDLAKTYKDMLQKAG